MDSSQIRPKKSLLVIGGMPDRGRPNPNPQSVFSGSSSIHGGHFSKPGLKRDFRKFEDSEASNSLYNKKSRTTPTPTPTSSESNSQGGRNIVAMEVEPLTIVQAKTPKLSRQFWKAGDDDDYVPVPSYCGNDAAVRVHPQFLHANATSHKWALGALVELLDNSLDEVCNGATYVHVDSATNQKDKKSRMLTVEANGGGMNPSRFRECLSLGYSRKRHMADKVGQYGNGFKTSTMRLGADAIVFSRSRGINGNNPTQSIGMLSYTFLYETKKCEAIVPTVDFELVNNEWKKIVYNSSDDWFDNLETILEWSPYLSQQELFDQFESLEEQGTRIVIYNLWEDDEGKLELDFDSDPQDIQLRGVNRDEKNIDMARKYPNSRHFLTYRHSYASILYLRRPKNFKIILRGEDIKHHNLLDDMMMTERKTYTPMSAPESECSPDQDKFQMSASLELGFVKDASHHIDIQGFNVYHKNRLIKPFWRVWNAAGSDGRGVIGILEANFIQPAHNKQGFERTAVLAKLENRLIHHQKAYWSKRCQDIGYAPRRKQQKSHESIVTEVTRPSYQKQETTPRPSFQKQETTPRPFNNVNLDKGSSSTAPPDRCRQNLESFGRNQNSQVDTRESAKRPEMVIKKENHGPGIKSYNETGVAKLAAELRKVKEEAAAELQKVKDQSAALLHKVTEEAATKLQKVKFDSSAELWKVKETSAAELQKLKEESAQKLKEESAQKLKEVSAKVVAETQWQKTLLELQLKGSRAKLHDLENAQKEELQRQKTLLELQLKKESKDKIQDLETALKDKTLLELQLKKESKAKIQDLENALRDKTLLELQVKKESKSKIQDLENALKEKTLLELQLKKESKAKIQDLENALKEKTLLELQLKESKAKIQDLENAQREKETSAKIVAELERQKTLCFTLNQLHESHAKIQGLENAQKGVSNIFQEERTRRDVTEDALRTKLQEASQDFDELWNQIDTLRRRRMSS